MKISNLLGEEEAKKEAKKGDALFITKTLKKSGKKCKKLRVFEAFAGIGAQRTALDRLKIDYEIVGISEWFIEALHCYCSIHENYSDEFVVPSKQDQLDYLNKFTFSKDSINPTRLELLNDKELKKLYISNKLSKNFGSITEIKGSELPDFDLLVYSFPCQDLSTGGNNGGMGRNSGTRSGLLWEIERILLELNKENRLPEYLLLENVFTITADSHIEDLNEWLGFLESLGYSNDEVIKLNALDFGVPQNRNRAFIASHLGSNLNIASKIDINFEKRPISNFLKTDYTNETYREEADEAQLKKTPSREKMWELNGMEITEETIINTITTNMDRTYCAALFEYDGPLGNTFRRPTIREAFLMMGFTEEEYERTKSLNFSYRKMNKLIGNSIVVDVISAVLKAMFIGSDYYVNSIEQ